MAWSNWLDVSASSAEGWVSFSSGVAVGREVGAAVGVEAGIGIGAVAGSGVGTSVEVGIDVDEGPHATQ